MKTNPKAESQLLLFFGEMPFRRRFTLTEILFVIVIIAVAQADFLAFK